MKSLAKKADYNPMNNEKLKEFIEKQKEDGYGKKEAEKIEQFLKNPNSFGVDLVGDCFIYMEEKTMGLVLKVNNAGDLKKAFTVLGMPEQLLKEKDGISVLAMGNNFAMGWDDSKLLVVFPNPSLRYSERSELDMESLLMKQMKQTAEESINAKENYAKFISNKKDISMYSSYDSMFALWGTAMANMDGIGATVISDLMDKMKDIYGGAISCAYVSFEKGEVVFDQNVYYESPEKEAKMKELMNKLSGNIQGDQLKYLGENPLVAMSLNLKGEGVYNYIGELGLLDLFEKDVNEKLGGELGLGTDFKSMISLLEGDITFAVNGVKKGAIDDYYSIHTPQMTLLANLKDAKQAQDIFAKIGEKIEQEADSAMFEKTANGYAMKGGEMVNMQFGIKDNTLYVTNSDEVYANILAAKGDNKYAGDAKGKRFFLYGNLNSVKPMIAEKIKEEGIIAAVVMKGVDLIGSYGMTANDDMVATGKLVITDDSANSLAVIFQFIDSFITLAVENNI